MPLASCRRLFPALQAARDTRELHVGRQFPLVAGASRNPFRRPRFLRFGFCPASHGRRQGLAVTAACASPENASRAVRHSSNKPRLSVPLIGIMHPMTPGEARRVRLLDDKPVDGLAETTSRIVLVSGWQNMVNVAAWTGGRYLPRTNPSPPHCLTTGAIPCAQARRTHVTGPPATEHAETKTAGADTSDASQLSCLSSVIQVRRYARTRLTKPSRNLTHCLGLNLPEIPAVAVIQQLLSAACFSV